MDEFELIARYFTRPAPGAVLGGGDDCALLAPTPGMEIAVTTDMMVDGRHFLASDEPATLGHKLAAVNLSDLAAMGATPRWALLALALPEAEPRWLEAFANGLFALLDRYAVDLVGGDTTRGPRNLVLTALGETPAGQAIRRSGACAGDWVWVSGELGDAALALAHRDARLRLADSEIGACTERLQRPLPRVELGIALRGVASAMIDVSDGLVADLGHVCEASRVGARLSLERLPCSPAMRRLLGGPEPAAARAALLAGGDDYELCFTAPRSRAQRIEDVAREAQIPLTAIGEIVDDPGLPVRVAVVDAHGSTVPLAAAGFDHFRGPDR